MTPPSCATCAYLITSDGMPYYCAARDLYYFRKPSDTACEDYISTYLKRE